MKTKNPGFQITRVGKQEVQMFQMLIRLFQEMFDMKKTTSSTKSYLQDLLHRPGFIAFVAIREKKVVGGITAYVLPRYYSGYSEVFIYDLAVQPEFQRRGLGKKLIAALKKNCKENGIREIFVAAYEKDTPALDFYQSTDGKAEKVIHFNYTT
jgi:aminoglycoside 3-N-acetyltransferase I